MSIGAGLAIAAPWGFLAAMALSKKSFEALLYWIALLAAGLFAFFFGGI